jgi:hypothetical protein
VTPAKFITAIVTEQGVIRAPFGPGLRKARAAAQGKPVQTLALRNPVPAKPPPPPQEPEPDPYDPERSKRRRRAGPRLVDFSLGPPLAEPDPGPAVPRPYAPQKRVKPADVVPPTDNPLRGWRYLGFIMLARDLWPRDASTNPVMVYYSGRRRGRFLEDLLGLAPWGVLLVAEILYTVYFSKLFDFWSRYFLSFLLLIPFTAILSATMTAFHLRRTMMNFPLEQMLVTRLKVVDIVQGLSIRPLAVQSAATFFYHLGVGALAFYAAAYFTGGVSAEPILYAFVALPLRWFVTSAAVEWGGAVALRAHLCIRSTLAASIRMMLDMALMIPAYVIALLLGAVGAVIFMMCIGGFFIGALGGMSRVEMISVFLVVVAGSMIVSTLRILAHEAMDWCHFYPDEWWVANAGEDARVEHMERTPWQRWEPSPNRRKIFLKAPTKLDPKGAREFLKRARGKGKEQG